MTTSKCWLGVMLVLPFLPARGLTQTSPDSPAYLLCSERVKRLEGLPFTLYKLQVGQVEFQFVPPPKWSVKYDPDKKILTLLSLDLDGGVTLNIEFGEKEASGVADGEQLKARILERYEGARRLREYRRPIAGVECAGYDFEWPVDKDLLASFRVIEVAFSGGKVEFEMKSSFRKFADFDPLFSAFLGSVRIQSVAR